MKIVLKSIFLVACAVSIASCNNSSSGGSTPAGANTGGGGDQSQP